ncbi:MAG: DNA recombination protein RmuC [Arenicellaceae bacterium]|nr:DNA recombination protein RmuC [Arenicellaceae bacterium]
MIEQSLDSFLQAIGLKFSPDARAILLLIFGLSTGWILGKWWAKHNGGKELAKFASEITRLERQHDEQIDSLRDTFSALSQNALQANNQSFLNLAKQTLGKYQEHAKSDLESREKSIANMVNPLRETLDKTDQQLRKLEQERARSQGQLNEQIQGLMQAQSSLHGETRNLVQALRKPEVRGQWGELTLKRLAELSGMSQHCDFTEQPQVSTDTGVLRPDMIVHMPGERDLIVDVKTPLDAYLSAVQSENDEAQSGFLKQHAKNVKMRIRELSEKKYWNQFEQSPDFIVLFIPGDQFLSAALEIDHNLIEYAMERRIILATPTSLVGLLRAISYGWSQDALNKNASAIRDIGRDLHNRLAKLSSYIEKLGNSLDNSVTQFNRLVRSYESKVLPGARKFSELGVAPDDEPTEPKILSKAILTLTKKNT